MLVWAKFINCAKPEEYNRFETGMCKVISSCQKKKGKYTKQENYTIKAVQHQVKKMKTLQADAVLK